MKTDEEITAEVNAVIEEFGCRVTGITDVDAVAVKGDARETGPGVTISIPEGMGPEKIAEISNLITNRVPYIARVLMDI